MKKILFVMLIATGVSFAEWCSLSEVEFVQPRKDGVVYIKLKEHPAWLKMYTSDPGASVIVSVALTALTTGQKVQFDAVDGCSVVSGYFLDWSHLRIIK